MEYIDTPDFYLHQLDRLVTEQQDTIRNLRYLIKRTDNVGRYMSKIANLELAITAISSKLIKQGYRDKVRETLTGKVLV